MSAVDNSIIHCLEEIDARFVKAIDIVGSMRKSVKEIASNMKQLDEYSKVVFGVSDSFLAVVYVF